MRPSTITSVCVYCGSSQGADPLYAGAAVSFGEALGRRGLGLVYGGGSVGLMGVLADTVLRTGGTVHGVITSALLDREVAHPAVTVLQVVETMHERKAAMADAADAFVMLPGGLGTLEEFLEVLTWNQLGVHAKPCGILDVRGYFAPLLRMLDAAVEERFLLAEHRSTLVVDDDPVALLDRLPDWEPAPTGAWLDRSQR